MTMDTYELVVREMSTHHGIDVDILDEDGLVEETTQVTYADFDLAAERDDGAPLHIEEEFTADARALNLQLHHYNGTFDFHAVADDETVATVTVTDTDWDLVHTG
jgi:hypothetical protein